MATGVSPSQDDHKAERDLLKRVASNLGIKAKVVREMIHSLLKILSAVGPSRVALSFNKAIADPVRVLWNPSPLPHSYSQTNVTQILCISQGVQISVL